MKAKRFRRIFDLVNLQYTGNLEVHVLKMAKFLTPHKLRPSLPMHGSGDD